jgi:hypothetical protein
VKSSASTDVDEFVAVSEIVETMAVDTYNGMLAYIEDKVSFLLRYSR